MISALKNGETLLTDPNDIADHVVDHFTNLFYSTSIMQDNGLIEECVPNLLNDDLNRLLTLLPSHLEIKNAVFALNRNSAPWS
jgi:hypothetical protein